MATKDRVTIELYVDDQGTVKIRQAKAATEELAQASTRGSKESQAAAEDFASSLMKQIGIYALVTAAAYKVGDAVVSGFKAGIQAVDDFKLTTIGVAATLADMAKDQSSGQENYFRALAYSKEMFKELELAAAKYFASGKDMTQAWNILAQKGVVLRYEEIDALGIIVDRIRLSTQGQVAALQIAQEMRSVITGQARATDQVGMLLKDRVPNLEEELKKHREIGDVVTWLASQFKGLAYASEDIQSTLESQKSTLSTLLTQVGRAGLEGAYNDIAGWVAQINDYLRLHGQAIGGTIAEGWAETKRLIEHSYRAVKGIYDIVSKPITWLIKINFEGLKAFNDLMDRLPWSGSKGGGGGGGWGGEAESAKALPADLAKPGGTIKGGGGGGKGRDTTDTLESLILQLRQEEAKLTEGAFAGVDAWYTKITEKIKKLAMDDQQLKDGMLAATELKTAKEQKVSDDLNKWYLGQMHQTTAAQLAEDSKKLASVKGHVAEEDKVREVMQQHALERSGKLALAENQQAKTYYDSLAASSILIKDQVVWKEKSWELEKKISQQNLEQWFRGKDITESQKDEYRGLLALTNQATEYNKLRQKAVDLGTLEGWAIERAGEALKREKTAIKDVLDSMEGYFQDAFAQGITGALSGETKSFKEVGKTIVQSMVLELNKKSFTKIWDDIAKLIAPETKSTLENQGASGSVSAAKELTASAGKLTDSAGGLSLSGVQLGLSAGGLLLSGIGIATNSQALVYAGAVLQLAGLAIQLYEALSNTVTTATMTASAAALTGSATTLGTAGLSLGYSATALTSAAAALSAAAGSEGGGGILSGLASIVGWFFHSGGQVPIYAHSGLNLLPDERLIVAQTGEGILPRPTMSKLGPAMFEKLRRGDFAATGAGDSGGGYGGARAAQVVHHSSNITIVTPEGKVLGKSQINQVMGEVQKRITHREIRVPSNRRS